MSTSGGWLILQWLRRLRRATIAYMSSLTQIIPHSRVDCSIDCSEALVCAGRGKLTERRDFRNQKLNDDISKQKWFLSRSSSTSESDSRTLAYVRGAHCRDSIILCGGNNATESNPFLTRFAFKMPMAWLKDLALENIKFTFVIFAEFQSPSRRLDGKLGHYKCETG